MTTETQARAHEDYLFKIVNKVIEWDGADVTPEEVADLVMLELINVELPNK